MLLDSEESIDKVDWFISKMDNQIYGLYRGFILYSFYYDNMYMIEYTDRSYKSKYTLNDELFNYLKQKKLIEYGSVNQYLKIYNRQKIINSIIND